MGGFGVGLGTSIAFNVIFSGGRVLGRKQLFLKDRDFFQ